MNKTYECIEQQELFTAIEVNGKKLHIKFEKYRTHPTLSRHRGLFFTDSPVIQEALETHPDYGKKWKKTQVKMKK